MKHLLVVLFTTVFYSVSFAQDSLSLEKVIELAMKNNYDIQIAANNVNKSELQYHIGNAGMLPEISASGSIQNSYGNVKQNTFTGETNEINNASNNTRSVGLSLNQTLFDGFAMFKTYDKLGKYVELQSLKKQEEVENMITQVSTSYYDVIEAHENIELIQQSLNYTNQQYLVVQQNKDAGKATLIDILNMQVILAEDSSALLETELILNQNLNYLSFLLGGVPMNGYVFNQNLIINDSLTNQINLEMIDNNVLVKQALANLSITELDYQIYKAAKMPNLFGSASYNYSKSTANYGFSNETINRGLNLGLTASWTIFQGFKRDIQMQTAQVDQMNQEITGKKIKQNLTMDFNNAKISYATALKKSQFDKKNLTLFEQQYRISKTLFENGRRTSLELREAQKQLFNAKNKVFRSIKEAKLQEIELLRLSGRLIDFS